MARTTRRRRGSARRRRVPERGRRLGIKLNLDLDLVAGGDAGRSPGSGGSTWDRNFTMCAAILLAQWIGVAPMSHRRGLAGQLL
jgi:hypothetical protein